MAILTTNASKIEIKIGEAFVEPANMTNGEYTDSPTSQEIKVKGSTYAKNLVTYHAVTASGTWARTADDAGQEGLILLAEGTIGEDCQTEVRFTFPDGTTRTGIFNVAITNMGFSGAADEVAYLEAEFTLADGQITKG